MDFEFETARTGLANAFAAAGAELLAYQPLVSTAVAAIPDTQPQKYAIAGTLPGILQMAGKIMGEEGDLTAGGAAWKPLTDVQWMNIVNHDNAYYGYTKDEAVHHAVNLTEARLKVNNATPVTPAAAEKPTGDLTEKVRKAMIRAYGLGQTWWQQADSEYASENKKADVTAERFIKLNDELCAAIAAHLARLEQQAVKAVPSEKEPKPSFFVIVDKEGDPEFVTKERYAAQEHINDACMTGIDGAGKWKAVPVFEMRPTDDHLWNETIRDRDTYHDWADKLAEAIATHFGAEIGEHSNMNCPWAEALEVIECAEPASQEGAHAALEEVRPQWTSVADSLPEKYCLAVYETPSGKQRIIRAMYVAKFTVEAQGDDCYSEINDENDIEYLREGWYELIDNWGEYSSVNVCEGVVTHWQPLPPLPSLQTPACAERSGDHA